MTSLETLSQQLSQSLRRPSGRTLRLLDRALAHLAPFESPKAAVVSQAERRDLLDLLRQHRTLLTPYLNTDRIESNLLSL